jgi:hypothetical protein
MKRKLDKVNTKTVAKNIAKVATISRQVTAAINEELNKPENKKLTESKERKILDIAVIDNVKNLKSLAEGITGISVATKKMPSQSTLDARRIKLVDGWETTVEMIGQLNKASTTAPGGIALTNATADGLNSMQTIVGGFGVLIPQNLNEKIKVAQTAITAAHHHLREITKLTGEARADAVMNLVTAINSGGTLTVKSENDHHPIKVNIKLDLNAKQMAKSLIKVQGVTTGKKESRIMVTAQGYAQSDNSGKVEFNK